MFCKQCGSQIAEGTPSCPYCGVAQDSRLPYPYQPSEPNYDSGNVGWGFLGFFLPVVGLIPYLVLRKTKPKNAKCVGIGTLISTVICSVIARVYVCVYAFALLVAVWFRGYF